MNFERFPGAQYANIFSYLPSDDREGYAELDEETLHLVGTFQDMWGMRA